MSGITRPMLLIALAGLALSGCGESENLSGTYVGADGISEALSATLDFEPGGTAYLNFSGQTRAATYRVDGEKVIVTNGANSTVFVRDEQGCLDGGRGVGKFCRQ